MIILESGPKEYIDNFNDFIFSFKSHNYRNGACFLIGKLCKDNQIANFLLSLNIEMLNYTLNEGKISNNFGEYNAYFKYKDNTFIKDIDDMTKIDLS